MPFNHHRPYNLIAIGVSAFLALILGTVRAQTAKPAITPEQTEFFETRVRPVLFKSCFTCHGPEQQLGNLRLDSESAMKKGNAHGPGVIPGDPDKSLLVQAIRYTGKIKMPPSGKLTLAEIDALTQWVKTGATWPESTGSKPAVTAKELVITEEQRRFWSFRPIKKPAVPAVKDASWAVSPIDRFILAKLERKNLRPAAKTDRRSLIRRAYYDLIGLPPTIAEIEEFVADKSPNAFAGVVDRLLASPQYGERWGRLWLDVARYADTRGYVFTEDRVYHNAYTYRDYVIRAFNDDLPFNRFIVEQLAADKLNLGDDRRPLAGLGFLTVGRRFLNNPHDIADDRIDVTARGFLGLTVNCARCHDHKFDPIPTKDYYSLYGVFASSTEPNPPLSISPKEITEPYEKQNKELFEKEKQAKEIVRVQVRGLRDKIKNNPEALSKDFKVVLQRIRVNALPSDSELATLAPVFEPAARDTLKSVQDSIANLKKTMPRTPEFAMAVQDIPNPITPHVFLRGNPNNRGDEIPRRFLAVLSGPDRKPFTNGSGRLELADDIASNDNPLTARVIVNRIWMHHFGAGIVRTPSDFGTRGEAPTQPELLDYLASRFMEEGWSIKKLHRLIMLSSTYQQSSECDERKYLADPENRLVSRMNRKRLDLEQMRDSLLFTAGKLDVKMGGPSVEITTSPYSARRTVYGFVERQNLPGFFRTFDFASPDSTSPQRFRTTIPQQALFMMNSPFVVEQARAVLVRPEIKDVTDTPQRVRILYRLVYGRNPDPDELADSARFINTKPDSTAKLATTTDAPHNSSDRLDRWAQYAQVLLMSNEFCFVD